MRSSASPPGSSGWTSRDPSCSCSGASLLTTTWISVQTPQLESPSVAGWTVTPAVPSSPLAFPSRYSQGRTGQEMLVALPVLGHGGTSSRVGQGGQTALCKVVVLGPGDWPQMSGTIFPPFSIIYPPASREIPSIPSLSGGSM